MRASGQAGQHLSGAERLVPEELADQVVLELLARARGFSPASIHLTIEEMPSVSRIAALHVSTLPAPGPQQARAAAETLLESLGIQPKAIELAFAGLTEGLGTGGRPTRGACVMDSQTGERLEPDRERGVRASHLDFSCREEAAAQLAVHGLSHHRTLEALAVASKVIAAGVLAELCCSDDPDYVAGYLASAAHGYVRFPHFKPQGGCGGRVFFIAPEARSRLPVLIDRLEREAVLIEGPVLVQTVLEWERFAAEPRGAAHAR